MPKIIQDYQQWLAEQARLELDQLDINQLEKEQLDNLVRSVANFLLRLTWVENHDLANGADVNAASIYSHDLNGIFNLANLCGDLGDACEEHLNKHLVTNEDNELEFYSKERRYAV